MSDRIRSSVNAEGRYSACGCRLSRREVELVVVAPLKSLVFAMAIGLLLASPIPTLLVRAHALLRIVLLLASETAWYEAGVLTFSSGFGDGKRFAGGS